MTIVFTLGVKNTYCEEKKLQYPWLDSMHNSVVKSVSSSALWFDDFFALDESAGTKSARGEARIRLGWEPRSRDLLEFETRFKVKVKLPNLKNRVDLVFSDYDDEQADNPLNVLQNNRDEDNNRFNLALRWRSHSDSGFSHRLGVGRGLQVFAKSRYRNQLTFSDAFNLRWEAAGYLYSRDGLGAEISGQFSYQHSDTEISRFNHHFYYRDRTNDWFWQQNIQYLSQLDIANAYIVGVYFEGKSQPTYQLDEYLVSVRWRKNALRDWLFFELEPFVLWRRDENFSASYGLAFRVEGYFGQL